MAKSDFDFGLSGLSTQFHQDTDETPLELARLWAERDARGLRTDISRLLEAPLPDWALTALWRAASSMVGMEGVPDWLREVESVCAEQLATAEQQQFVRTSVRSAPPGSAEAVLKELSLVRLQLAEATARPYTNVSGVVPALELTVRDADPNLGFRLLLRCLSRYWIEIDQTTYDRYVALGEEFGLGEHVVEACAFLIQPQD